MTPIQFALMEVRAIIPERVLTMAFTPMNKYRTVRSRAQTTSIDYEITHHVIDGRVRPYVDTTGAQEITVPLSGLNIQQHDTQAWSCHIPKTLTKGRRITSVLGVAVGFYGQFPVESAGYGVTSNTGVQLSAGPTCGEDIYARSAKQIWDAHKPVELNYTANVYLIDENTIYCEDKMPYGNLVLRCHVSADEEFSFITGGNIPLFAEMVVLATKAYIYTRLSITLEKGALEGGIEVGTLKEFVDKYSDAEDQFQEFYREKWRKVQAMSDKVRRVRHLNRLISRY